MRAIIYSLLGVLVILSSCKKDFLDRFPQDDLTDDTYWTSENNIRTFAWGFYPEYFTGYGSGNTRGAYHSGETLNDDFAPTNPTQFTRNVPASGGGWSFTLVRKANIFINRVQRAPISDEAINHWVGVGRFFRALEYHDLVKSYGDMPWFGRELTELDVEELYKPRDSRVLVMDSVLEDFKYAAEHVRASDGNDGLTVNKYVVLAYMSRVFLFHGTWLKYHNIDQAKAVVYLEAAKWAADQVIASGKYQLGPDYRGLFNALSLTGNKEMIMYRQYETGILTHTANSYVNKEPQSGISKDAIDSYLAKDGLPISISPLYKGDKTIANVLADRDPRIQKTVVPQLRINGLISNYSTSGYSVHKFLNESIKDLPEGNNNLNPTDAPVIRYGEVLINYAEAAAELGNITQADLDKSINVLRDRADVKIAKLQVVGGQPAINTVVYDDPKRDPTVPSMLWEIRRERRIELMMEGFRYSDLRRWKKLNYTDTQGKPDINKGAWIKASDHPGLRDIKLDGGTEGYIIPAWRPETQRIFENDKVYLNPLPLDQIKLYSDYGSELKQNAGWQ